MFDNENENSSNAEVVSSVSSNDNNSQKQEFNDIFKNMSNSDKGSFKSEVKEPTDNTPATNIKTEEKTLTKPDPKDINNPAEKNNNKGSKSDRYGELTRKWREEQRRAKKLESELAEYKAKYKPTDRMSVNNDAEWIEKQVAEKLEMSSKEMEAKRAKEEADNVERDLFNHKIQSQIPSEKLEEFVKDYQSYVPELYKYIPEELDYMAASDVGPSVIHDFLNYCKTDKDFLENFVNAHPIKRMNILLQAEDYHKAKINNANVKSSESVSKVSKPKPTPVTPNLGVNKSGNGNLSAKAEFDKIFRNLGR